MTEKDIRPIPQSILKEIYKRDLKIDPWQTSIVRYYAYLAIWKKELVKVTVAVSTIQNKHWAYKQVAVHGIHTPICLVRDIEYNYFGFGYRVGWYAEELQAQQKPFEDGRWHTADKKYYDPYAELINRSVIAKLPEYKYSAYQYYKGRDIISYLRIYEKYPQTEYLLKLGLGAYAENLSLLKKIAKDKVFCKWFIRHRNEIALPWGNAYNKDLELTKKLADVAQKYMPLQHNKRSAYICVIAQSPADLIREGETLHHCVGRMCYDLRMVNEESLIFFIRTKAQPEKPFVTLEYSLKTHKVLQCYGIRNSKPNDETLHYVNKIWLPYANKTIKQIVA